MAFAFGPDRRLRSHAEFVRAQKLGRRVVTPHFTLLVATQRPADQGAGNGVSKSGAGARLPAEESRESPRRAGARSDDASARPPRLGLVVGRKVGNAVQRNRIKRVCRECFRLWPDLLPPGVDLVVIARPGAQELDLASVRSEWSDVQRHLRKRAMEALARREPTHHSPPRTP
jgi:ribonuclease P protein component